MADARGPTLCDRTKKRRNGYNENDKLRKLPENVLVRILSLLPTKDAVRTCVLSTEWKHMWTLTTTLHFDDSLMYFKKRKSRKDIFMNFVERVLLLHGNSKLESFSLCCCGNYDEVCINSWISTALRRNAKSLVVSCTQSGVIIPGCIYESKGLTSLKLPMNGVLRVPCSVYFSSLKILEFRGATLQHESSSLSKQLCLKIPVLEVLNLEYCEWINVDIVNIYAPALQICTMGGGKNDWWLHLRRGSVVNNFGLSIKKFKLHGHSNDPEFTLNSPSLVGDATIRPSAFARKQDRIQIGLQTLALLSQFSNAESLALSNKSFQAFAHLEDFQDRLPTFDNLTNLTINGGLIIDIALASFLQSLPALESLTFENGISSFEKEEVLRGALPQCLISQLKVVVFKYFSGTESEVEAAMFFLQNANKLEEMSIKFGYDVQEDEKRQNEISTLLRGSGTRATILFV